MNDAGACGLLCLLCVPCHSGALFVCVTLPLNDALHLPPFAGGRWQPAPRRGPGGALRG